MVRAALILAAIAASAGPLSAQDSISAQPGSWVTGGSIGTLADPLRPDSRHLVLGAYIASMRDGRLGSDVSVGVVPKSILFGVPVLSARAVAVMPFEVAPNVMFVPSGGASALAVFDEGGRVEPGVTGGVGFVSLPDHGVGFRAGLSLHMYRRSQTPVWQLEIGLARRSEVDTESTTGRR